MTNSYNYHKVKQINCRGWGAWLRDKACSVEDSGVSTSFIPAISTSLLSINFLLMLFLQIPTVPGGLRTPIKNVRGCSSYLLGVTGTCWGCSASKGPARAFAVGVVLDLWP